MRHLDQKQKKSMYEKRVPIKHLFVAKAKIGRQRITETLTFF